LESYLPERQSLGGSQFKTIWGKTMLDLISTNKSWTWWQASVITETQEAERVYRRITVHGCLDKM
jgi:hypothetical protein